MPFSTLNSSTKDRIAFVTLNRPDKLNALNEQCKGELRALFASIRSDAAVDAVILTGAGEKAFVAGTDIAELAGLDAERGKQFSEDGQDLFDAIQHLGKPVIAAVNGYALGGGCELAMACHIRIAAENARFGQPEVNLGIIPGYGGTQRLARIAGIAAATDMILTGRQIDAAEALRIGLVTQVVPRTQLLQAAEETARAILAKGQIAIRIALKALNAALELPLSEGLKVEASMFGECCSTSDFKEGTTAFLQKRPPAFKGV